VDLVVQRDPRGRELHRERMRAEPLYAATVAARDRRRGEAGAAAVAALLQLDRDRRSGVVPAPAPPPVNASASGQGEVRDSYSAYSCGNAGASAGLGAPYDRGTRSDGPFDRAAPSDSAALLEGDGLLDRMRAAARERRRDAVAVAAQAKAHAARGDWWESAQRQ